MRFRTLRGRLTALSFLIALGTVAFFTVVFNVVLDRALQNDAKDSLRTQAAAASTTVDTRGGQVRVRESPNDAAVDRQVWVYQGFHPVERAPGDAELQHAADSIAGTSGFDDLPGRGLRLYAAPITSGGRRVGTVVVAQSLSTYDRTTDLTLLGSLALAVVMLAAMVVVTRAVIGRALGPVHDMTRSAAAWSEHGGNERFGGEPRPDELGELARTFDALLDRVAASLRHEQRLSAELSHELRTPLARMVAEVELLQRRDRPQAERREAYEALSRSAAQMERILETLMAAARAEGGLAQGRSDVTAGIRELERTWRPIAAEHGIDLRAARDGAHITAGVDAEVLQRIVGPLLDNACRYARHAVWLESRRRQGRVLVTVSDDGPGVPAGRTEEVFESGRRAGLANGHGGAGLGLALARRLARAAGGDVVLAEPPAERPGAVFAVDLPG
jgi:two-component system heavy metal sensor histidine kinase CusS